jgi:hypothetical protein
LERRRFIQAAVAGVAASVAPLPALPAPKKRSAVYVGRVRDGYCQVSVTKRAAGGTPVGYVFSFFGERELPFEDFNAECDIYSNGRFTKTDFHIPASIIERAYHGDPIEPELSAIGEANDYSGLARWLEEHLA